MLIQVSRRFVLPFSQFSSVVVGRRRGRRRRRKWNVSQANLTPIGSHYGAKSRPSTEAKKTLVHHRPFFPPSEREARRSGKLHSLRIATSYRCTIESTISTSVLTASGNVHEKWIFVTYRAGHRSQGKKRCTEQTRRNGAFLSLKLPGTQQDFPILVTTIFFEPTREKDPPAHCTLTK